MVVKRDVLINFINKTLDYDKKKDPYGPNGLQVIGKENISKIVLGVSANLALFQKAAEWRADMVIVHHGLFWNGDERIIGKVMKARLKILFDKDITLLGYHLLLDNHPTLGNNAQMIKLIGAKIGKEFGDADNVNWGFEAEFKPKISLQQLEKKLRKILKADPKFFAYGQKLIGRLAVVSGGGPALIKEALNKKLDAFVTGEAKESTEALAKEGGINFIYLGHYNSEKFGVIALGKLLKKKFPELEIKFIDIPNNL
jgi:dinuclear metal center YbgI/SA1388 family protein